MNQDLKATFAAAVGGRARLASNFAARTFRDLDARADREIEDAAASAAEAFTIIDRVAARLHFDQVDQVEALKAEWLGRFRGAWAAFQGAGARTMNWMVTGPSRFPVERNRKRMDTEHKRLGELLEIEKGAGAWAEKRIKRIIREQLGPVGVADAEHQAARAKLAARERRQALMKAANAEIRKARKAADPPATIAAAMAAAGFPEIDQAIALQLLKPDFAGRIGFAAYQLSNNLAEIQRLRARVYQLEARAIAVEAAANAPEQVDTVAPDDPDAVRLVKNALEQRVQLIFPGKPAADIRDQLKRAGFRWSPTQGAWQRQLTTNGVAAARRILAALEGATNA